MPEDAPPDDPQFVLLADRREKAAREAQLAARYAISNSIAHYVFGILGVAGGVTAAATASASPTWVPVLAGALAALGSGLSTLFGFEARSAAHEKNRRLFQPVAEHAENELARVRATKADADEIARTLAVVQAKLDDARSKML